MLDIEFEFRDNAAIGGTGHGRKHGGEPSITTENLEDHEAFVGASGSTEAVDHLNGTGNAGAEADAVVGAGDVIVHSLRNADDLEALFVEANAVAQSIVATDGNESVNAKPGEILQDFRSEVVFLCCELILEMRGDIGLSDAAGIGARGMEKGTTGAAGAIDDFFVEKKKIVGVVVVLFSDHVDETGPAVANADNLITFPNGARSDATNSWIEAGNI